MPPARCWSVGSSSLFVAGALAVIRYAKIHGTGVCTENLNTSVVVMKSAQDGA
jgi:hypothetical protein